MEGEQFSLCWNNFHSNLSSGFNSLLKEEHLVDVTIAAGGRFLKAHKTVLSICSPFFKELFRANPSDHPIVILPEVSYSALCHLLEFMYKGEVSVSQEEIPSFMKVAEMLKVKGLTDNPSSSSNEFNGYGVEKQGIKKPQRPIKRSIKPSPPPRESPKPPMKKPCLEENYNEEQEFPEALVKPKEEPADDTESNNSSTRFEENSLDLSSSFEGKGESSRWQEVHNRAQDTSTPGPTLIKSGRGQLVLMHDGHLYIHSDTQNNRHLWVCVKKKTLNCEGTLTTLNGPILLSYSAHNHPQLQDIIQRLKVANCTPSPESV